jgi:1-acyl-sn-glycerol-3-phosphate acyltransferase
LAIRTLRAALATAALAPVALAGVPAQWLALKFGWLRAARAIPTLFHRCALRLVGVRVTVLGELAPTRPLLLAANHCTWLDISVLSVVAPVSFVAKAEIAGWPVFGTFARLQRSIFVDRARRSATGAVSVAMAERLNAGDAIVLFAEGTSSDGNRILPFRSALLGAAREALGRSAGEAVLVQPVSIAYVRRNGLPLGVQGRPQVAWYGDIDFAPHLWAIMGDGAIDVTVTFGEPLRAEVGTSRKALARDAERAVRRMTGEAIRGR